ncbi:unnamed protein product [Rotaria sp. Silwood1]|nr:unnamed protein product [Rotaria sp. Silwood1]
MPRTDVTVSGISSGGAMAVQLHMAFSNDISGCGILAGPPYYCAGNFMTATACMSGPLNFVTAPGILLKLPWYGSMGSIDNVSNIHGDPVYIFTGKYDLVARPSTVKINEDVYSELGANIKTNYDMAATHGFPTDNFGKSCSTLNLENYINNCDFNMAYDILNHLYGGNLIRPKSGTQVPLIGHMAVFDQKAFMNPPSSLSENHTPSSSLLKWISESMSLYTTDDWDWPTSGLVNWDILGATTVHTRQLTSRALSHGFDQEGFIYFPSACAQGQKCSIHVALHGCQQGKHYVDDVFATKAGYLEVAELNNLIVVFPQVAPTMFLPTNPMGCWDWWGYSSLSFATKTAPQMASVKKMIDTVRLINQAMVASV